MLRKALLPVFLLAGLGCQPAPESGSTASTAISGKLATYPEAGWLDSEQVLLEQLRRQAVECLDPERVAADPYQLNLGRAAFNTPTLLGGQAARMGLSCNSCHRSGQDNPQFFISGISGAPGTLDVTHGFFSEVREDGLFNPVPIPSLLDVAAKTAFGSRQQIHSLEAFVHGVIVDEFAGHEPATEIMAALLFYVSALDSHFCERSAQVARSLQGDLDYLDSVLATLHTALAAEGEEAAVSLLVLAAQTRMRDIYLRFQDQSELSQALEQASRELRQLERLGQSERSTALQQWLSAFRILGVRLQTAVAASGYQL